MSPARPVILPILALALAGCLWLCHALLGGAGAGAAVFAADGTFASGAGGALAPSAPPEGGQAGALGGSGREEIPSKLPFVSEDELEATVEEEGTRLTGTVVRSGGSGVAAARVAMRKSQPWFSAPADLEPMASLNDQGVLIEAETDDEGKFVFFDVEPGKYSIAIRAADLAPLIRSGLEVPEHEGHDLGKFSLELGVRLAGRVVGARGKGLEGVQVLSAVTRNSGFTRLELPGFGIPVTRTDVDGDFEVTSQAPGAWELIFEAPGYRVAEKKGSTEPAGRSERGILIQLETGLSISGDVLGIDVASGRAMRVTARVDNEQPSGAADDVSGAERHRPRHGEVGVDGKFDVAGLSPGVQYKLRLYRQAEPDAEDPERELDWKLVRGVDDVVEMAGTRGVEFKYRSEGTLVLVVKNKASQVPITRCVVHVSGDKLGGGGHLPGDDDEPRTDFPAGEVRFEGLRPAENGSPITVRIRAEGFVDFEKKGSLLRPGQELDLGVCELEPAPVVKVKVTDGASGKPIEGVHVLIARAPDAGNLARWMRPEAERPWTTPKVRDALTDAKGIARITAWPGAICVLKAFAENYQAGEDGRSVPPHTEMVELKLTRGGSIQVIVVDSERRPVPGMYVEHAFGGDIQDQDHYWNQDAGRKNKTGDTGTVVFENLAEGKHTFRVLESLNPWGNGGESAGFEAEGDVFLAEGGSQSLELRVSARGGLQLVLLESGAPLAGALARLTPVAGGDGSRGMIWFGAGQEDPRTKISDHAGRAEFAGLKVGSYKLRVSHANRRMITEREVLIEVEERELTLELGLAVIEGQVRDPAGDPIESVAMTVRRKSGRGNFDGNDYRVRITEDAEGDPNWDVDQIKKWSIETDRDGRYALRGVASDCELTVQSNHRYVIGKSRSVGPLGSNEFVSPFDFVLERAGALSIRVEGINRRERGRIQVELVRMEGEQEKERRSSRVRSWRPQTTVNSIRPGTWRLRVKRTSPDETLAEQTVTVAAGETRSASFNL